MKTIRIYCDLFSDENGYKKYVCPRICSDDWDELCDPCSDCSHNIPGGKIVEIKNSNVQCQVNT